ncbi:MAG: MFS transporter [Limnochordaceae bacterium]|nr:MFS transporter [Limnochordaceae bacterium]
MESTVAAPTYAGLSRTQRWVILTALGIGTIMGPLDGSVVNIALPQIRLSFQVSLASVEWVSMIYLLVISSLLLTYGRVGDLYGHRPVYLAGFTVFTAGSLLCSLAPTLPSLLLFRAIQAIGAGMLMASGPAILTDVFPPLERGQALGINAMVVAVGLAAGPIVGGYLVDHLGWRSIFYVNLPIGLVGTWWAARVLPPVRPNPATPTLSSALPTPAVALEPAQVSSDGPGGTTASEPSDGLSATARPGIGSAVTFDPGGAISISVALGALLLAISYGGSWGWTSVPVLALFAGGVALLATFISIERRHPAALVDLDLFRNRLFSAANLSSLLNYLTQFIVTFLMPFYLQDLLGLSPSRAGELLIAYPLTVMLVAPFAGWLSDRLGSLHLAAAGMGVMAVAIFFLSQLNAAAAAGDIVWRLALFGLGTGLFQSPNNSAIMGSVPRPRLGQASGMLATMRNVGMVLGIAVSGATFSSRQAFHFRQLVLAGAHSAGSAAAQHLGSGPASLATGPGSQIARQAFVLALHDTFLVAALLATLGMLTSLIRGQGHPGQLEKTLCHEANQAELVGFDERNEG